MPIIRVSNLTKIFTSQGKTVKAVDRVSFSIDQGEIVGLLGPNGAGKTTTIQMMLGLLEPTAGKVEIFGKEISTDREAILRQVNFSSAYVQMPYNLTVREVLTVFAHLYEVGDVRGKVNELLTLFELSDIAQSIVGKLSSGQQTRLNLAKAFLNDPKILFLDEPTASLDPLVARKVRSVLANLHKKHQLTIVYTSHNMAEVRQMVDRIIFLHRGRIVAAGTPSAIAHRQGKGDLEEAFVALAKRERV